MDTSIRKYYREGFLPSILSAALTVCGSRLPWPSFSMSPDLVIFLLAMPLPSCIAITSTPVYPQYFPTYFHEYLLETTNYRLPYVNMHSPPSNSDLFYMEHYYVTLWESLSMLFLPQSYHPASERNSLLLVIDIRFLFRYHWPWHVTTSN